MLIKVPSKQVFGNQRIDEPPSFESLQKTKNSFWGERDSQKPFMITREGANNPTMHYHIVYEEHALLHVKRSI